MQKKRKSEGIREVYIVKKFVCQHLLQTHLTHFFGVRS